MPPKWTEKTDESDYDLIALTLDRMEAAAGAGQYRQAEQARLEAYAFFEFGPERRLRSFDQGLALDIEGLIWFGALGHDGLAKQIAQRAPRREIRETRLELDKKLGDAAATLGDSANKATVVTNSAIIVFREGLEGVLILAAITASMVGLRRRLRRPVFIGALAGLGVSVITWVLAQTLLRSLERYGEKLEAVVGLVAIGVLLLITNWFFHKVYWSEWIAKFHRQRKRYEKLEKRGFISAQAAGLFVLGLTSVYREGFETVLFLQSLQLSAGTATVLEGAGLGLAMTLAVAAVTFFFQRKLPYKRMLIVTGVFIGFVLVVMVGQTVRTMQGTGWVPITPLDITLPVLGRPVVRRLPDGRDDRRAGRGRAVRDRELLPGPGDQGQAAAAAREGPPGGGRARVGRESRARGQRPAVGAAPGRARARRDLERQAVASRHLGDHLRVERAEPLEHELAGVERDDRRGARRVVRVLAPDRALVAVADQRHVRPVPELLAGSRASRSARRKRGPTRSPT